MYRVIDAFAVHVLNMTQTGFLMMQLLHVYKHESQKEKHDQDLICQKSSVCVALGQIAGQHHGCGDY